MQPTAVSQVSHGGVVEGPAVGSPLVPDPDSGPDPIEISLLQGVFSRVGSCPICVAEKMWPGADCGHAPYHLEPSGRPACKRHGAGVRRPPRLGARGLPGCTGRSAGAVQQELLRPPAVVAGASGLYAPGPGGPDKDREDAAFQDRDRLRSAHGRVDCLQRALGPSEKEVRELEALVPALVGGG